jgi:hypothetical protein
MWRRDLHLLINQYSLTKTGNKHMIIMGKKPDFLKKSGFLIYFTTNGRYTVRKSASYAPASQTAVRG